MPTETTPLLILLGLAIAIAAEAYIHYCRHQPGDPHDHSKERNPR